MADPQTPGERIREMEGSMGQAMAQMIDDFYDAHDLRTATGIREAATATEAAEIVGRIRRGRVQDVLWLAASGAAGAATGVAVQKAADLRIGSVPPLAAAGVVAVIAAAVSNLSLVTRATFAVGGAAYAAGSYAYTRIVPPGGDAA